MRDRTTAAAKQLRKISFLRTIICHNSPGVISLREVGTRPVSSAKVDCHLGPRTPSAPFVSCFVSGFKTSPKLGWFSPCPVFFAQSDQEHRCPLRLRELRCSS